MRVSLLHALTVATITLVALPSAVLSQSIPIQLCTPDGTAPSCTAVRGDRNAGWLPQARSEVMARNGVVATMQPLAAEAGLRILQQGGNAVDAAVAAAATLNVTFPSNVGIGGDLFTIIYVAKEHKFYQLNSSGIAPSGETLAHLNSLGYQWNSANWGPGSGMPSGGILDVTVPGSLWGWQEVLERFGTMNFKQVLQPAIDYAENGFPISETIADAWHLPNATGPIPSSAAGCCTQLDPDSVAVYYINGAPPSPGTIFKNPDLARTFRLIQEQGRDVFYKGEIAQAIVAKSQSLGGTMTLQDLANYKGEWVTPAASNYHGQYSIYATTAPSNAWGIVEEMNILEACVSQWYPGQTLASLGPASPLFWHALVETKKLAYADLYTYNADPNVVQVPVSRLTSKAYAASQCSKVNPSQASTPRPPAVNTSTDGDTIAMSVTDRWGNMVSWINSNFSGFGAGITVPGYGFILHNRGGLFTLDPKSPNVIAPQKRPYNTLSAVFVEQNGAPLLVTSQDGGTQQAQGNMQVLVNILDLGANMQQAGDMARFSQDEVSNTLTLESALDTSVGSQLAAMGHHVVVAPNGSAAGGYQGIMLVRTPTGSYYRGGSQFREDGAVAAW